MNDVSFIHGGTDDHAEPGDDAPVAVQQRWRILDATTRVLYGHGYADVTVSHIVREARVSRRTFYENFENKEHAYLAAFSGAVECMAAAVRERYTGDSWAEKMAGAFTELARLVTEHPDAAHTCLVEVGAAGREGENRRADGLQLCRDGLLLSLERDFGVAATPLAVELAVGGVHAVLLERLRLREADRAAAEMPAIANAILTPLVGAAAAGEVAERIRPVAARAEAGDEAGAF